VRRRRQSHLLPHQHQLPQRPPPAALVGARLRAARQAERPQRAREVERRAPAAPLQRAARRAVHRVVAGPEHLVAEVAEHH
jgi:hypothetical protein